MKKALSITIMLLMAITMSAQKRIVDRNLIFNGKLLAYSKAEIPNDDNAIVCEPGTEWYLENKHIGHDNYVSFWIQTSDGRRFESQYWKGNKVCIMTNKEDGKKFYFVFDDTYMYVSMTEWRDGYILHLYTKER